MAKFEFDAASKKQYSEHDRAEIRSMMSYISDVTIRSNNPRYGILRYSMECEVAGLTNEENADAVVTGGFGIIVSGITNNFEKFEGMGI